MKKNWMCSGWFSGGFFGKVGCGVGSSGTPIWVRDVSTGPPGWRNPSRGFHDRAVRRMAGMGPKRQRYGKWVYTPIGEALDMVGLKVIGAYIVRRQNTVRTIHYD